MNSHVYVLGCPCHILHNTSSKAASTLARVTAFDIEDLAVDVGYWFDKSTKRKAGLEEFCAFCNTSYKEVVLHSSTCWLSLEQAVSRILELYVSLVSYFRSTSESQARFARLEEKFSNPITEVYLLFYQSVFPLFTRFNKLLQRDDPVTYLLYSQMTTFFKRLMTRFIKPEVIVAAGEDITNISHCESSSQLEDRKIYICIVTRSRLNKLLEEGDVSPREIEKFMNGVKAFYESAVSYALTHLPLKDELLQNAEFVNIRERVQASFTQVTYFVERFSQLLPYTDPKSQEILFHSLWNFKPYKTVPFLPTHGMRLKSLGNSMVMKL